MPGSIAAIIIPFAVPSRVCRRHLSVGGKQRVTTSPDKFSSSIGKYMKQRETLLCFRKDHSAIASTHLQRIQCFLVPFPAVKNCGYMKAAS